MAALQRQLEAIGLKVEAAAERYNGAVYRLETVTRRIDQNERDLVRTQRNLVTSRDNLVERVRGLYRRPDPGPAAVLLTSGSIVGAAEEVKLLRRVADQDVAIVGRIKTLKHRIVLTHRKLVRNRKTARRELAASRREKAAVEAILVRRQRVLNAARGDLRRALAAEQARIRRQAEIARQAAIAASNAATRGDGGAGQGPVVGLAGPLPSGAGNAEAARIALQYQGVPYVWGGASPSGFDCSGLASYAFGKIGKVVPHYTGAIWAAFPKVPYDQLQAGDLVFFHGLGHMGIYIGNGQMVHAPHTGDVVRVANMADRAGSYVGAVRP